MLISSWVIKKLDIKQQSYFEKSSWRYHKQSKYLKSNLLKHAAALAKI